MLARSEPLFTLHTVEGRLGLLRQERWQENLCGVPSPYPNPNAALARSATPVHDPV